MRRADVDIGIENRVAIGDRRADIATVGGGADVASRPSDSLVHSATLVRFMHRLKEDGRCVHPAAADGLRVLRFSSAAHTNSNVQGRPAADLFNGRAMMFGIASGTVAPRAQELQF